MKSDGSSGRFRIFTRADLAGECLRWRDGGGHNSQCPLTSEPDIQQSKISAKVRPRGRPVCARNLPFKGNFCRSSIPQMRTYAANIAAVAGYACPGKLVACVLQAVGSLGFRGRDADVTDGSRLDSQIYVRFAFYTLIRVGNYSYLCP